jgi:hypothetical protein
MLSPCQGPNCLAAQKSHFETNQLTIMRRPKCSESPRAGPPPPNDESRSPNSISFPHPLLLAHFHMSPQERSRISCSFCPSNWCLKMQANAPSAIASAANSGRTAPVINTTGTSGNLVRNRRSVSNPQLSGKLMSRNTRLKDSSVKRRSAGASSLSQTTVTGRVDCSSSEQRTASSSGSSSITRIRAIIARLPARIRDAA